MGFVPALWDKADQAWAQHPWFALEVSSEMGERLVVQRSLVRLGY